MGIHMSSLPEVRELTPFGRWELLSQAPKECWPLSNHKNSSYSPVEDPFGICELPMRPNTFFLDI